MRGCLDWQVNGLGLPEEVRTATDQYRSAQDVLGGFLYECCIKGPDYSIRAGQLYSAYLEWAKRTGEEAVSQRKFGESMTERGFGRRDSNGVWYLGIAIRQEVEQEQ